MEYMNSVSLRGIIGSYKKFNESMLFTLCTVRCFKGKDGIPVIENTWHECFLPKRDDRIDEIQKGTVVELSGRIVDERYTKSDGTSNSFTRILVNRYNILGENSAIGLDLEKQ